MPSFAHLFCQQHQLADPAYGHAALRACLHLPARLLYHPIQLFAPNFFSADLDLINGAGWLTNPEDLDYEFEAYRYHPFNRSRWRRRLGLCVSSRKVQRLVWRTLRASAEIPATSASLANQTQVTSPRREMSATPPSPRLTEEISSDPFAHFPLRDHSGALER